MIQLSHLARIYRCGRIIRVTACYRDNAPTVVFRRSSQTTLLCVLLAKNREKSKKNVENQDDLRRSTRSHRLRLTESTCPSASVPVVSTLTGRRRSLRHHATHRPVLRSGRPTRRWWWQTDP